MGLINAIQSVIYFSRGGRLIRWDSRKHPRDKNGRFKKIGGSSFLYGAPQQVTFTDPGGSRPSPTGGGGAPRPNAAHAGRPTTKVDLDPGDRVYGLATGSKVVQHADGTGTYYVTGKYNDRIHLNARGVQTILRDKVNKAKVEHVVPGQIVRANNEQEADQILRGPERKISHKYGDVTVRIPEGSVVQRTGRNIVVHHTRDGSATVYNPKDGTHREEKDASTVLPELRKKPTRRQHPNSPDGMVTINQGKGDHIYVVEDGIVVDHRHGPPMFYPVDSSKEPEAIDGDIKSAINEHGGVIRSKSAIAREEQRNRATERAAARQQIKAEQEQDDSSASSSKSKSPSAREIARQKVAEKEYVGEHQIADGSTIPIRWSTGDVGIQLQGKTGRGGYVVRSPDGSGIHFYAGAEPRYYTDIKELPVFQDRSQTASLGKDLGTIEYKASRLDKVYVLKNGVLVQDSFTQDAKYFHVGKKRPDDIPSNKVDGMIEKYELKRVRPPSWNFRDLSKKPKTSSQEAKTHDYRDSREPAYPTGEFDNPTGKSDLAPDFEAKNEAGKNYLDRYKRVSKSDRAAAATNEEPSINTGGLKNASQDSVSHPDLGNIKVTVQPGSQIRQVEKGLIVSYPGSTPSVLFKPDGSHSRVGSSAKEVSDRPVTALVNADGKVVDFHTHMVYGGESDTSPEKVEIPDISKIPDSMFTYFDTQEERDTFLKLLREQGIEELDGLPIELKLQVAKKDK